MKMKTSLTVLLVMELLGLSSALIKQHFFVNKMMKQREAKLYCKTFYHDLSTFTNDSEELQFLEDAVRQSSNAWVGLRRESGVWKWSGGENAMQLNWDTSNGQPDNNGNCAFLHKDHKRLHDASCTAKNSFFCMELSEFVLVQQNESWEGALGHCREHYTDLACLSSAFRADSALEEIRQTQTEYVWTGLRFLIGHWLWISGDDLNHTAWPGQPQCPDTNLRCGALDNKTGFWTNRDCEEKLSFICIMKADVGPSSAQPLSTTSEDD